MGAAAPRYAGLRTHPGPSDDAERLVVELCAHPAQPQRVQPLTAPPSAKPPPKRREISTYSRITGVE
ncbi:hypothetical protein GCM10010304_24840 [Streptomyces roseoviolaceus]